MPSIRETILQALHATLQTQPAPVLRGEVLPERVPAMGLLILRDGDPGEPEVTLSPLPYHYQHRAEVEAVVQRQGVMQPSMRSAPASACARPEPHARWRLRLGRGRGAAAGQPSRRGRADTQGRGHPDRGALREPRSPRLIEEGQRHGTCTRGAGADGVRVRDGLRHARRRRGATGGCRSRARRSGRSGRC